MTEKVRTEVQLPGSAHTRQPHSEESFPGRFHSRKWKRKHTDWPTGTWWGGNVSPVKLWDDEMILGTGIREAKAITSGGLIGMWNNLRGLFIRDVKLWSGSALFLSFYPQIPKTILAPERWQLSTKGKKRQEARHWEWTGQIFWPLDSRRAGKGAMRNKADNFRKMELAWQMGLDQSDKVVCL